ncbi:MAG: hypothetical protein LUQ22_02970 [Methanotrichaceae archaeon]|nr:hypothetical protein [Methanotrichaceae archaeon]
MRIKIPISLVFAFILIVLNVHAILQPHEVSTGGSLADKLIEATQGGGILRLKHTDMPAIPQQSRALHENNLGWTPALVWTPLPGRLSIHTTPWASESQGQVNESSAELMPDTAVEGSSIGTQNSRSSSANLAGTWSLDLNDITPKQVGLTLFQVEDKVFGSGSMKNGNDTLVVAASGSPQDDQIYLDITSIGKISLYSLVLSSSGDRRDLVSGDYKAYTAEGQTWMGKVQGSRILPTS